MSSRPLPNYGQKLSNRLAPILSPKDKRKLYALVEIGAMQLHASPGEVLNVSRLTCDVGQRVAFKKVLVCGGEHFTALGRPYLAGCRVIGFVEQQKQGLSVASLFRYRGMRYARWQQEDPQVTSIRVESVEFRPAIVGPLDKHSGQLLPEGSNQDDPGTPAYNAALREKFENYGKVYGETFGTNAHYNIGMSEAVPVQDHRFVNEGENKQHAKGRVMPIHGATHVDPTTLSDDFVLF